MCERERERERESARGAAVKIIYNYEVLRSCGQQ